jgi:hypothetical protein
VRKTSIGLIGVLLGVPIGLLGDRVMSGAPSWVWALIATAVVVGGAIMALLSDPVFQRIAPLGRKRRATVTLLVFIVCGTLGAAAWRLMLAWEETDPARAAIGPSGAETTSAPPAQAPVTIDWMDDRFAWRIVVVTPPGLALARVKLFVTDVKVRSGEIYTHRLDWFPFTETAVPASSPGPGIVLPGQHEVFDLVIPPMSDMDYIRFAGRTVTESGEWELTLKCVWHDQLHPLMHKVRFSWVKGEAPRPLP